MSMMNIRSGSGGLRRAAVGGIALGAVAWSSAAMANEAVANLVEKVSPAVVTVYTTQEQDATDAGPQFNLPEGSPFEEFFKRFGMPDGMPGGDQGEPQTRRALGSGFLIESDGYIVTNNHVVENADQVKVKLNDQRSFEAKVIGTDPQTDIALLKIDDGNDLPHLNLGNSDDLRVGEDVVAVGNPFGLGGTVTTGIISAIGRDIHAGPYVDFIQTDAAINHGNSGGPLFDIQGDVIGVNSAIYSPNGGSVGVGFAIPSNIVKNVVAQLKESGNVSRGWLGVAIQNVTPDIADAIGMDGAHGALVANVVEDSPSAGKLETGDVIVSFDGKDVESAHDLPRLVASVKPGTKVDVAVLRNGKKEDISVKLGELQPEKLASARQAPEHETTSSAKLGATVAPLTAPVREQLGLDESVDGAVITSLKSGGAAARAGLEVGDVIVRVGNEDVKNAQQLDKALAKVSKKAALLLVNRHGDQVFMSVNLA